MDLLFVHRPLLSKDRFRHSDLFLDLLLDPLPSNSPWRTPFPTRPADQVGDAEPAVDGIEHAAERKKIGEQRHGLTVSTVIHGRFSPSEVHGFWGVRC